MSSKEPSTMNTITTIAPTSAEGSKLAIASAESQTSNSATNETTTTTNMRPGGLGALSSDEVRLVMQQLDRASLIRLIRCSRQLYADGDSPIGWKFQHPFPVSITHSTVNEVEALHSRRLFRYCPTSVIVSRDPDSLSDDDDDRLSTLIDLSLELPNITRYEFSDTHLIGKMTADQWTTILTHPTLSRVTHLVIRLRFPNEPETVRALLACMERMEGLTDLDLLEHQPPGALRDVHRLSHLTSLRYEEALVGFSNATGRALDREKMHTPFVIQSKNLVQLHVKWLCFSDHEERPFRFHDFATAPTFHQLRVLTLTQFHAGSLSTAAPLTMTTPVSQFAVGFSALVSLEKLILHNVCFVDDVLDGVCDSTSKVGDVIVKATHPCCQLPTQASAQIPSGTIVRLLLSGRPYLRFHTVIADEDRELPCVQDLDFLKRHPRYRIQFVNPQAA